MRPDVTVLGILAGVLCLDVTTAVMDGVAHLAYALSALILCGDPLFHLYYVFNRMNACWNAGFRMVHLGSASVPMCMCLLTSCF